MLKKILICFIITLLIIPCTFSFGATFANSTDMGFVIYNTDSNPQEYVYSVIKYNFQEWAHSNDNNIRYSNSVHSGYVYNLDDALTTCYDYMSQHPESIQLSSAVSTGVPIYSNTVVRYWIFNLPYRTLGQNGVLEEIPGDEPPEPEPGSSWLSDVWDWFLWQLGLNDDYSGDIDAYITGGDREPMSIITPTPSPTPSPYPSPTPYSLTINYPDGTTGTITGIPGNTTIINGGDSTTNNYGSDFDIFAVDLQIGDGGTSNPRDGLNSVMDGTKDYLSDIDITPVSNSFSLIPNDWFLLIGVLGAIPIIAGFISKLLK